MAPIDDNRKSRTRREDAPAFYQAYLNSPGWRSTRNAALKRANYTCHRCGSRRDLNVHHTTYERLGAEMSSDLEVLCFGCHNEHHRVEAEHSPLGIYLKIATEVVNDNTYQTVSDISDRVKSLCAQLKIPVKPALIAKAISLRCALRQWEGDKPYQSIVDAKPDGPLTHGQAVEFLARLTGVPRIPDGLSKRMPRVKMVGRHYADSVRAFELITQAIQESIAACEALEGEVKR